MSIPTMRMGLVGFPPDQKEYLENLLKSRTLTLRWQSWSVLDADALWVYGARARNLTPGYVRVPAGEPTARATVLSLTDMSRPLAFTLPLGCEEVGAGFTFDPKSADSVGAVMRKFEAWLRPSLAQFGLADALANRQGRLTSPIYHIVLRSTMIGIVNLGGPVGLLPSADPADFDRADWHGRPGSADTIPAHFTRSQLSEIMWHYVSRTPRDLLPARYRANPIYFRRPPRMDRSLVKDVHLTVLQELARSPQSFEHLQQQTGLVYSQLSQVLAALYFAGCITTDGSRAGKARSAQRGEGVPSSHSVPSSVLDADSQFRPSMPGRDWTVPVPLDSQR